MPKPLVSEFESSYIKYYIDLVQGDDIIKALENQLSNSHKFLRLISEEQGNFAYAENKWSLKEVLGHVIDTERIIAYRALCISRGEKQSLPGFEQDDYVKAAGFNKRTLSDLIHEFKLLRESNLALFKSFDMETKSMMGKANGKGISVRALLFMIAGHEIHHINVIKTKYLS